MGAITMPKHKPSESLHKDPKISAILNKPPGSLTEPELLQLLARSKIDNAGLIEVHIVFALRAQKNSLTPEVLQSFVDNCRSPLLALSGVVYQQLTDAQLDTLVANTSNDGVPDAIVVAAVDKCRQARALGVSIESLKVGE
jgi:hypothetical protein